MKQQDNQILLLNSVQKLNANGYKVLSYSTGFLRDGDIPMEISKDEKETFKKILPLTKQVCVHESSLSLSVPEVSTEFFIIFEDVRKLPSIPTGFKVVGNKLYTIITYVEDIASFLDNPNQKAIIPDYKIEQKMVDNAEVIAKWVNTFCS